VVVVLLVLLVLTSGTFFNYENEGAQKYKTKITMA
jgi:hypothetical protein